MFLIRLCFCRRGLKNDGVTDVLDQVVFCRRGLKNDGVTAAIARKSRCSHDGVTMKLNTWITPHP